MKNEKDRIITFSKGKGVFYGFADRIKLIFRLLADRRVSFWLKLLPIGSLVYLIAPDIAPGPIDDALLIWLGTYLFIELCPPDIVKEHEEAIRKLGGSQIHDEIREEKIVDAEYWDESCPRED